MRKEVPRGFLISDEGVQWGGKEKKIGQEERTHFYHSHRAKDPLSLIKSSRPIRRISSELRTSASK
jgi:hypothetical protein